MAIEIERKFLVKSIPENKIQYSHHIKQGYIVSDKDKVIRIRQKGDDYFITIKGNKVGISRFEFEYPIPKPDAKELFKHFCKKGLIEKNAEVKLEKGSLHINIINNESIMTGPAEISYRGSLEI